MASIAFHGAAGTVTGSKFLLSAAGRRVLVDCGLFQGLKELRSRNWAAPPFDVRSLDAVVLTHAHVDHSGYLPVLVRHGWRGPVHATPGTAALVGVLLRDAARLQEEDAEYANRHGTSKHQPALPLFDRRDVEAALQQLVVQRYGQPFDVVPSVLGTFRRAGHILGSATIELLVHEKDGDPLRVVGSGDLGRYGQPILVDPEPVARADVLLVESTYGDKLHPPDTEARLADAVNAAASRGGALLVPAFAVGRTQTLIWMLDQLQRDGRVPKDLAVFIDSPMAAKVTDLYCRHTEDHDEEMRRATARRDCPLCNGRYGLIASREESQALNERRGAFVVIAGSGMATGGRILHHLRRRLPDARTTVLFVGYQAEGTRGRALQEGAREVKMLGGLVPVRAQVATIGGLSAHADQGELLRWMRAFSAPPRQTFVVHGEPAPAAALAGEVSRQLRWQAEVARDGQESALVSAP